ncbi:MAG: hypothetical protein KDH96_09015, partial [Candidatus Riesia sp.]|nr:hypothetical protein [Candidatus Riesia sp.]
MADENKKKKFEPYLMPIILSDGFKEVLKSVLLKGKSKIAERLLEWDGKSEFKDKNGEIKKIEFDVSYIDRTDKDDVVTFLQTNRYKRQLDMEGEVKNPWEIRGRAETRIGRLVRKIFGTRFNQESVEKFVNKYKSIVKAEEVFDRFEIVRGNDIRHWYYNQNYDQVRGTLGNSCMSHQNARNFFPIYINNPEQAGMLILKNEKGDKIRGRAIVWNLSEPEGVTYMDRVYTIEDAEAQLFINYAKQHGWQYGGARRIADGGFGGNNNNVVKKVILDDVRFNRYPYMDTMRYLYSNHNLLSSSPIQNMGQVKTLSTTNGSYNERGYGDHEPEMVVDYRGEEIEENQAVWCEYEDTYCLREDATYISKGEHGRGKYFIPNSDFLKYSEYSDSYYHRDDVVWSEFMKDWLYKRYAVKMYLDKDKKKWSWNHKLTVHDTMGKIGDDYFINDILYRDRVSGSDGKLRGGDYHFKDEHFNSLPEVEEE